MGSNALVRTARALAPILIGAATLFLFAPAASAAAPAAPTIIEPEVEGQLVSPADVHMEATGYSDPDGDPQGCSDWQIWTASPLELIWQANCAPPPLNIHIHQGDGDFIGSYAGASTLNDDTDYILKARFHDSTGAIGPFASRSFRTYPPNPPGTPGENPWVVKQPGYSVQKVAGGLQLPVDIAFVPNPGSAPGDPLLYVTELYGGIKVLSRDGHLSDYASGLLNFSPTGDFPGSGEQGVTGIVVDPDTGDVFASMVYADGVNPDDPGTPHYNEVVRFQSSDGGLTASSQTRILDLAPDPTGASHQISNLTIGPDGKLYVHVGDGETPAAAENLDSALGKILRVNLDGSVPTDNPLYDDSDGVTVRDEIAAYGFRNPFGGVWRASNGAQYEVEDGPNNNARLARLDLPSATAYDFGWDGTAASMRTGALYNWSPPHALTNIAIVQPETFGGSGFPAAQMDHAFVAESGPTYASGPQGLGKRIVEFDPDPTTDEYGTSLSRALIEYNGVGYATVVGLAAGPDGLYFTDLYKDVGASSPSDPGANLWRVAYTGIPPASGQAPPSTPAASRFNLKAAEKKCRKKYRGKALKRCVKRAKAKVARTG